MRQAAPTRLTPSVGRRSARFPECLVQDAVLWPESFRGGCSFGGFARLPERSALPHLDRAESSVRRQISLGGKGGCLSIRLGQVTVDKFILPLGIAIGHAGNIVAYMAAALRLGYDHAFLPSLSHQ